MEVQTLTWTSGSGWSGEFPAWNSDQTLVLAFAAPELFDDPRPIAELAAAYPEAHVHGCSTAGEIIDTKVADHSLVVAVARFEHSRLTSASATIAESGDSSAAGEALARELAGPDLRAVLVFSEGSVVNGSALVRGLNAVLPETVVVTGGLAGDGPRFERTWIVEGGAAQEGKITALGLYGDQLEIGHGSKGGWDMFGPDRVVTRAEANVLYELDGKPALSLYKRYLGDRATELPASALLFPLSLRASREDSERVVRTILAVDEDAQSMTFAGDLPEGSIVQLMRANFDRLVDGASDAALMTKRDAPASGPTLTIAISCVGRRLVLGERVEEELEATLEVLPEGAQQVGFYSYGEISPHATGRCDLHNQTMTLTTIRER